MKLESYPCNMVVPESGNMRVFEVAIKTFKNPWFEYEDGDHGYVHIKGLDDETIYNNGPDIEKMMALCQELLRGLYMQVEEVKGDNIEEVPAENVQKHLLFAMNSFSEAFETYLKNTSYTTCCE